jgi:hypothetical protein
MLEPMQPEVTKQQGNVFVSFQQIDEAYEKDNFWKYQWKIELSPDETKANTFELFKLTEIISMQGNADIHPDIARQALIKQDIFDKYKAEQLSFKLFIGDKEPTDNFVQYNQQLTGWGFAFSMANISKSDHMYFHGKEISNVRVNPKAKFIGPNLELMSFETEKETVRYKNRIVLRKTPVEPQE